MADGEKSYSAGDLNLSIEVLSENALKSLDAVIDRLAFIEKKFNAISSLSKKLQKGNASKLDKNFEYIYGKNGNLSKIVPKSKNKNQNKQNNSDKLFNVAKITAVAHMAKRFGQSIYNIAQYGADFTETLNLWKVAMGNDLIPQATKFVDKMNEAYGISKETLMNAQATFKNMLGSLGNITDQQSYILSEGITQMALDYASLYNQTFEQAFTKFQAALAGQVRPIRSVSGYDITEQTLFDLYQSLGGDKSMRQLNRTEKQLLSILAIYQQMERTGAQGDLARTINSFANQSRVAKDQMKDILAYSGALITNFLETSGIMEKFVGFLIFVADVLEEVAKSKGALEQGTSDIFGDVTESAYGAGEAVDELQGKLLGFDKFRSLEDAQESDMGLDQTLIDALSKYQSVLSDANMNANEFAKTLKEMSGLFGENGVFNKDRWDELTTSLKNFGIALGVVFGAKTVANIGSFVTKILEAKGAFTLLDAVLVGGVIFSILQAIDAFDRGDIKAGILATTIGVVLAGAFILLHKEAIANAISSISAFIVKMLLTNVIARGSLLKALGSLSLSFVSLGAAIAGAFIIAKNWGDMNWWQKLIGIVGVATTAILGLAMAMGAFQSAWSFGAASAGIVAGIAAIVASVSSIKKEASVPVSVHANGGLPDKGSMFIAGESGAEFVYNMPSGQSGVANIQQIAQATYNGTIKALNDWWGGSQARGDIPQLREANATGMYQAVTGVAKSYGEKWSKY